MKKSFLAFICLCFLSILCSCSILPHSSQFQYVKSTHAAVDPPGIIQKIWIDNSFGDADAVEIQAGLDRWTFALNGYMTFETQEFDVVNSSLEPYQECFEGKAWCFIKINHTSNMLIGRDHPEAGTHVLAFCDRIGGHLLYYVRDRVDNNQMKGLTMHEIGHLLGAHHIDEDSDLMAPMFTIQNTQCIDQHTLEQVAVWNHFPIDNMNYCVYTAMDVMDKTKPVGPRMD